MTELEPLIKHSLGKIKTYCITFGINQVFDSFFNITISQIRNSKTPITEF
jgi:hypothetical protein